MTNTEKTEKDDKNQDYLLNLDSIKSKRILRYVDLIERGYGSRSTIWRAIKEGRMPEPSDFMGRPGWLLEVLEEYENSRPQLSSTQGIEK